jgi:hypothetical protein
MFGVSIDSLVLRRLVLAAVAVPFALAGLAGCPTGEGDDDDGCEGEDCEEPEPEPEPEPKPAPAPPVCGDGVCEEGETSACSDCEEPSPSAQCGNGICEAGETEACSDCAAPTTDAALVVQNNSSYSIWYFYLTPCSSSSWGSDWLGSSVIPSGSSASSGDIPPGCYDMRAETEGASYYWEDYGTYLSAGQTYTWTLVD